MFVARFRLQLQREPTVPAFEKRRKDYPAIDKTTLICRKDAQQEANELGHFVLPLSASSDAPEDSGRAICRIVKGDNGKWFLEHVNGETFVRLPKEWKSELEVGMCIRVGKGSKITIVHQGVRPFSGL